MDDGQLEIDAGEGLLTTGPKVATQRRFQLAEHLAVMPDIQFLVHPALNTEVDSI